jgi:exportin-T
MRSLWLWLKKPFAGTGLFAYVIVPSEEKGKSQKFDHRIDYTQFPLSPLGEIMLRVAKSNITSWPHPSVPLQFFECAVRYHDFFQLVPDCIPNVLSAFLDQRYVLCVFLERSNADDAFGFWISGLHQPVGPSRSRSFYLFFRFVSLAKEKIQLYVSGELVSNILSSVQVRTTFPFFRGLVSRLTQVSLSGPARRRGSDTSGCDRRRYPHKGRTCPELL